MRSQRTWWVVLLVAVGFAAGCVHKKPKYGQENIVFFPGPSQTWAIAPALNLSGVSGVDPLLQSDLVYEQLQQVRGLTVIPVNRVAEVYASLRIERIQSEQQAYVVCDLLGCDGLLVPTITAFDPFNPPKLGVSLQLFRKPATYRLPKAVDPRELSRRATPPPTEGLIVAPDFVQVVGMYDAQNGSVREELKEYVDGRHDPTGPLGPKEYLVNMDRYCGFVYHSLILKLLDRVVEHEPAVE
jgi:hypothetical protein